MKRKVLTMLLAVTMSATVGSPVCAADFTSGTENVSEFSENVMDSENASENTADADTASEEENETADAEKSEDSQEESDVMEFTDEEITDDEDLIPEFNDDQEDILTDSAGKPDASAKYPSMKKTGNVYTATVKNATEKDYVKFVPNKTGKYVLKMTITSSYGTYTNSVYDAYNSKFKMLEGISTGGYGAYKLEKGKTYYFGMGMGKSASKVVFQAEILADVVSIKPVKIDKSVAFYTPIDFYQDRYGKNPIVCSQR